MPWMSRWPRKSPRQKSNADEANDRDIAALLDQAEAIKDNPDNVLAVNFSPVAEFAEAV